MTTEQTTPKKLYLSCAETAKLVRQALKESFPGVKFGVRSSTYSGGASLSVSWTDGPNEKQVQSVVKGFKGAYFDGSIDYQGSIYHMMDGQQVSFGADYIHTSREYSDMAVRRALGRICPKYGQRVREVAEFRQGALWAVQIGGGADLQGLLHQFLYSFSDRLKIEASKTAGRVFVTHDDGYSRQCGSGFSSVSVEA